MEQNNAQKIIKIGTKMKMSFVSLTHEGLAVAKISGYDRFNNYLENFPIFVNGALIDEEGYVEITKLSKTYGTGKMLKLFSDKTSKERTAPKCENYPECGGCNIMHMSYDSQLKFKKQVVESAIQRIGMIKNQEVQNVIKAKKPFNYRNKVQIPFGQKTNGVVAGFYKKETHQIIPLSKCYIQSDESTSLAIFIKNLCNEFKLKGYDEKTHSGDIRHLLIKTTSTNDIMVVLVALHKELPNLKPLVNKIVQRNKNVKSVVLNINKSRGNTTLGNENILLYGTPYITDTLLSKQFRIGATSFYQVNHAQTEILYETALNLANFDENDILVDAYSGIGTIGIIASSKVKYVYGVEIVEEAVKNALENVKLNNITNATYECNKAEEQIEKWMNEGIKITSIVVDPPRKGCDEKLLETISKMNIQKVLYISCNPATLARDLNYLTQKGYTINVIQPVDMFPQSFHVECVVSLSRK